MHAFVTFIASRSCWPGQRTQLGTGHRTLGSAITLGLAACCRHYSCVLWGCMPSGALALAVPDRRVHPGCQVRTVGRLMQCYFLLASGIRLYRRSMWDRVRRVHSFRINERVHTSGRPCIRAPATWIGASRT